MKSRRTFTALSAAAGLAAAALAVAPGAGAATAATADLPPGAIGPFQVVNQDTARCMGYLPGDDRTKSWDCNRVTWQYWYLVPDGRGRYELANGYEGRCLAGYANGPDGWATWLAVRCDPTFVNIDQLWYVYPADNPGPGPIRNLSGRALETWNDNGAHVTTRTYQGLPNQQWRLAYVR